MNNRFNGMTTTGTHRGMDNLPMTKILVCRFCESPNKAILSGKDGEENGENVLNNTERVTLVKATSIPGHVIQDERGYTIWNWVVWGDATMA
uniref:Uncharacterized protein n=1 Tax=Cannabis sativa TaxID=3483 RepID=A0A803PGF9_CANSA